MVLSTATSQFSIANRASINLLRLGHASQQGKESLNARLLVERLGVPTSDEHLTLSQGLDLTS